MTIMKRFGGVALMVFAVLGAPHVDARGNISGHLVEGQMRDTSFDGEAGQEISISLRGSHPRVYFMAWHQGTDKFLVQETRDWWGKLPEAGRYQVRVFLFDDKTLHDSSYAKSNERYTYHVLIGKPKKAGRGGQRVKKSTVRKVHKSKSAKRMKKHKPRNAEPSLPQEPQTLL